MTLALDDRAELERGRVAVTVVFFLAGMLLGGWTARIPAIKETLVLSDGRLSIALLAFAAGAITGMQSLARLVDRYGSTRIMVPMALADSIALILPAFAPNLPTLVAALFVFGAAHGTLNIAMNANALAVERARQRPIISSCHATYSIGGFLGAAVGGVFAHCDADAATTFMTIAGATIILTSWAARWAIAPEQPTQDDPRRPDQPTQRRARGLLLMSTLAFCCLVGEGAAADWSTVYLRDTLGSSAGFAVAAYAAFSVAMMAGRLMGDGLATRIGPVTLVRTCGVLAAAGLGTALAVGQPVAGVIGFGCLGAGLSCIAPQVFAAAGHRNPDRAGQAIAQVASLGYLGFFVGPVLIGGAAEFVGLARALFIPVALACFIAVAATALRPAPTIAIADA